MAGPESRLTRIMEADRTSWKMAAVRAALSVFFLWSSVHTALDAGRHPFWRVTCAVLAPFAVLMAISYVRDASRLRNQR